MRVDDLRPLSLFDGLTDDQLARAGRGRRPRSRIEPGVELFHEGEHADFWWVLVDGAIDLIRHVGREDIVVGRMDVPGRWAGGFRAWDEHGVYLATGRGSTAGRVLRVPAAGAARAVDAWFPFGGHLIQGLYRTARSIESTARQRESLVTLGTLAAGLAHEINNPAAAATRAVDALEGAIRTLLVLARPAGRRTRSRPTSSPRSTRCAVRSSREPRRWTRWPSPTARRRCPTGSPATASSGTGSSPHRSPPPGSTSPGASGRRPCSTGPALEPAWSGWRARCRRQRCSPRSRSRPGASPSSSPRCKSYSQMDRASMQRIDVTEGLESTLVMLGHKLRDGVDGRARLRRRRAPDRRVRRRAQPGVDQPHRQRRRRDGRRGHAPRRDPRRRRRASSSRSATPVRACHREVAARAFEAFFTTKDVGKGTGLGLDIARRIVVERHGGTITIDSQPGRNRPAGPHPCPTTR